MVALYLFILDLDPAVTFALITFFASFIPIIGAIKRHYRDQGWAMRASAS